MNTFFAPRFRLGWLLLIVGAISSLFWFFARWNYENSLRSVQLTVDYEDTRSMADAYQIPHAQFLQQLKERGVTSVGVYQQTLGTLQGNGRVTVTPREEAQALYPNAKWSTFPPAYRFLITASTENRALFEQVWTHITEQGQAVLPARRVALNAPNQSTLGEGILISASQQIRGDAPMGYDPAAVATIKKVGMVPTARVSNPLNLNMQRVRRMLDETQAIGARTLIFSEDEVLGYDSLISQVAKEMRDRDLLFGNIEFTKQRGWADFASNMEGNVVRVHSVGGDEAAKTKTHLLVDRFARAIKERDVRVAYIRMVRQFKGEVPPEKESAGLMSRIKASLGLGAAQKVEKTALQQNLDFVEEVSKEVTATPMAGLRPALQLRPAQGFGDYPLEFIGDGRNPALAKVVRYFNIFCAGLGALGASFLLLNLFFDLSVRAKTWMLFGGLFGVGLLSASSGIGAKLIGLLAGCTVTPVAILWGGLPFVWDRLTEERLPTGHSGQVDAGIAPFKAFTKGFRVLVQTSLLTMIGPLLVVATYNSWKFISHTDEFIGEKATLLFPILLAAVAFSGEVFPHRVLNYGANEARRRAMVRVQQTLEQPFTMRVAVMGLLIAIGGYFFLARSGNDSGMEISSFEWNFRSLMERLFMTRPRTKELFIGMPAMIFAVYFAYRRQPVLALGAVIAIAIGQADILNTFCHFWTPLFYSLLRTFHAVWLGAIIGGVGVWIWNRIEGNFYGRMRPVSMRSASSVPVVPESNGVAKTNETVKR